MYVNEQYGDLDLIRYEQIRETTREGGSILREEPVLVEHPMDIYVNGALAMKTTCTPQYLAEMILGRILTEGLVLDVGEVESVCVCEGGKRGEVTLKGKPAEQAVQSALPVTPIEWNEGWIFHLADRFAEGTALHEKTWATHSCFLASADEILFSCEDIGRHNAMDKVIGYALRNQIDLRNCIVYSSGRVPVDMVMKTVRAGIPVLVSKAAPTLAAVRLAEEYRLTLICSARRDSMKVYLDNRF